MIASDVFFSYMKCRGIPTIDSENIANNHFFKNGLVQERGKDQGSLDLATFFH